MSFGLFSFSSFSSSLFSRLFCFLSLFVHFFYYCLSPFNIFMHEDCVLYFSYLPLLCFHLLLCFLSFYPFSPSGVASSNCSMDYCCVSKPPGDRSFSSRYFYFLSSSGCAFFLNRCSFLISVWSCRRLKLSLFLLLFLSSPWTSLFLCSQTLIWKRSNSSIIFAHIISVPPTWTQPIPGRTYSKRFRKMFVFIFISDIIHSWTM